MRAPACQETILLSQIWLDDARQPHEKEIYLGAFFLRAPWAAGKEILNERRFRQTRCLLPSALPVDRQAQAGANDIGLKG